MMHTRINNKLLKINIIKQNIDNIFNYNNQMKINRFKMTNINQKEIYKIQILGKYNQMKEIKNLNNKY